MRSKGDVLLVEDDLDIANLLSIVFERAGLTVEVAHTLADARRALAPRPVRFDAIVTDKNLPDGSGLVLLEEERQHGGDSEFVVITGYASLDSAVQAVRLGAYDYLEKPFKDLHDVSATVVRACEHRRVRKERDEARARAVLAERRATLVSVAAGIAHEVKNPLQGISFACVNARSALVEASLDPAVRTDVFEQLGLVEAEARRLRDLVEGVMDLARPQPRPARTVGVSKLLREVCAFHQSRAAQSGVRLDVVAPDALAVRVDEADVSRALDNMVRNALDVAPRDTTVLVRGRALDAAWAAIEVLDQGPGIPADVREKLFTPFFTTKARGFGLGLCQVAAAADRAGGVVDIEDNTPAGARVILRVPRAAEGGSGA